MDTQLGGSVDRNAGRVRIQLLRLLLHDQAGREDGGRHVHHESGTMIYIYIYNFLFLLLFRNYLFSLVYFRGINLACVRS